jgi:hypothetical protein
MADIFNQFFSTLIQKVDDTNAVLPDFDNLFYDFIINEQEVSDLLGNLDVSKALGPDGISPIFLKKT